jgi:serine/threonine protein kinase/tetratricopeptide (TPR) repeat protein
MGVVYKAEDMRLKRIVAIKFLPFDLTRDPEAKERFIQEARAASTLQHPNIATVHDLDEAPDGQLFIVQEYHGTRTLKDVLATRRRLGLDEALSIVIQIARGLAEVHRKGIIHRDIKPSNIMVSDEGKVKIVDFGLAKLVSSTTLTREGAALGTPSYMSPEQLRGNSSTAMTDLWSLGVLLYELLSGQRPFESEFQEGVIYAILHEDPVPVTQRRPELPADLDRVVARTLQKDPASRYPDMESMAADLELIRQGLRLTGLRSTMRRLKRSRHIRQAVTIVAVIAVAAIGLFMAAPTVTSWLTGEKQESLAIISCQNQTGEPIDPETLFAVSDALARYLSSYSRLHITSVTRLDELAQARGKRRRLEAEGIPIIGKELAYELCREKDIEGLVVPTLFTTSPGHYALSIEIKDIRTNKPLATAASHAGPLSALMMAVRQVADQTTRDLGIPGPEAAATIDRVSSLTTKSFQAYREFVLARLLQSNFRSGEFGEHILNALALDSTFGSAYMLLAEKEAAYMNFKRARSVLKKAKELGLLDDSPEESFRTQMVALLWEDRYGIEAMEERAALQREYLERHPEKEEDHVSLGKYLREQGWIEEAIRQQEIVLDLDPDNVRALNELAWLHAYHRGELERGLHYANIVESLRPGTFGAAGTRACIRYMMGDIEHAVFLQQQCLASAPAWNAALLTFYIYGLQEAYDAADLQLGIHMRNADSPFFRGLGLLMAAYLDIWRGHLERGRQRLPQALALADSTDNGSLRAEAAWLDLWSTLQDPTFAEQRPLDKLWSESPGLIRVCNPWYPYYCGLMDLRSGNLDSLDAYARQLELSEALLTARDQPVARRLAVLLRRERLLAMDSAAAALAVPYEAPDFTTLVPHINYYIEPGADGPQMSLLFSLSGDVEGRAYLAVGDTERAILEYERLVRQEPARRLWIPPLYHFQLASLYELSGAPERAVEHYEAFLRIWNRPDTIYSEPGTARERLRALRPASSVRYSGSGDSPARRGSPPQQLGASGRLLFENRLHAGRMAGDRPL